jgi:GNAT superfamily N-acetyltransferase
MYVAPDAARKGLGSALLRKSLLASAEPALNKHSVLTLDAGCRRSWLQARGALFYTAGSKPVHPICADLAAQVPLYKAHGFVAREATNDPLPDGVRVGDSSAESNLRSWLMNIRAG